MQNRFTVKDFFYMLIGGVICLLIWLNMVKTGRENDTLDGVKKTITSQTTTLSGLNDTLRSQQNAIDRLGAAIKALEGGGLSQEAIEALMMAARSSGASIPASSGYGGSAAATEGEFAEVSRFQQGFDARNRLPRNTYNQNNEGLPQQWQVAPDAELPEDFAAGDQLIEVWPNDAQKLIPLISTDAYGRRVHWYTHEYLVNFNLDAPFEKTPGLARAWEVSDDGLEVTFHLFENATWSDGKPVTADDVIFTWDVVNNPKMDTAHYRAYTGRVAKYEKIDAHTVKFYMSEPYFDAVGITGNLLIIVPKHLYGQFDEETFNKDRIDYCVGSGPFVLESWVKNDRIVLTRNENYWGPKPALNRYIIRIIESDLPKLQEFRAGSVDLIAPTQKQWTANADAAWFEERGAHKFLYYSPRGGYNYIGYNLRLPYFSDKRTRQALTMLIDRQALIDTVVEGLGMSISGPFFFKSDQYDKTIQPWPYDPSRARELLAEVGWTDTDGDGVIDKDLDGDGNREPFDITYTVPSGGALGGEIQRFVQEAFRAGGIKLNLDQLEWSVFLERLHERQYQMVTLSWTGEPEGDPTQIWHSSSEPNRGSNHVGFINPRADELIERGRSTMDYNERIKVWHEFHQLLHEEQPYTFLYARPNHYFLDKRFKGAVVHDYRLYYPEWYVPTADQLR